MWKIRSTTLRLPQTARSYVAEREHGDNLGIDPPLQFLHVFAQGGAQVDRLAARAGSGCIHLLLAWHTAHFPYVRLPRHRRPQPPQSPQHFLDLATNRVLRSNQLPTT